MSRRDDPDYDKKYYLRNRERLISKQRAYHAEHRDEDNAKARARYRENPREWYEKTLVWKRKNSDKAKQYQENYRNRHREAIRIRANARRLKVGRSKDNIRRKDITRFVRS